MKLWERKIYKYTGFSARGFQSYFPFWETASKTGHYSSVVDPVPSGSELFGTSNVIEKHENRIRIGKIASSRSPNKIISETRNTAGNPNLHCFKSFFSDFAVCAVIDDANAKLYVTKSIVTYGWSYARMSSVVFSNSVQCIEN